MMKEVKLFSFSLRIMIIKHITVVIFLNYITFHQIYIDLLIEVQEKFRKLRAIFKKENQEPWTSCEFDFTNKGKLNVSFGYIDWKKSNLGQVAIFNYYKYKKFGMIPEYEDEREEIKEIEQFIKEQEKE